MSIEPEAGLTDILTERWAAQLAPVARALPYPPTPNLAARAQRSKTARAVPAWGYAVALAAVVVALLLAVPSTRAGLIEFIQIGVVRLQLGPTATPTPSATHLAATPTAPRPGTTPAPSRTPRPTSSPWPSSTPLGTVLDIAGETTLAAAREQVSFRIQLPSYPADLGEPDHVYVQNLDGAAVVLVWLDPDDASRVRLTLHVLSAPEIANKLIYSVMKDDPQVITTKVYDQPAVWTTGPYVLHTQAGGLDEYRLIQGHVLIWSDGTLTYRLETDLTITEAVQIAESVGH